MKTFLLVFGIDIILSFARNVTT